MKVKGFVIFGFVALIAGGSLAAYAATRKDFVFNKYKDEEVTINEVSYATNDLSKIYLDVKTDTVKFISEDRDDILIKNKTFYELSYTINLENNELSIVENEYKNWHDFLSIEYVGKTHVFHSVPLEIIVPKTLKVVYDIDVSAGTINIEGIDANRIKLHVSAGTVSMNDVNVNEANIDISAGTVNIKNAIVNEMSAHISAGTYIYTGEIKKKGTFDVSAGTINLNFTDAEENYTVNGVGSGASIITGTKSAGTFTYSFNN